jgi:hypothetical protein
MVPGNTVLREELCLHSLIKTVVVSNSVTLLCCIKHHLNAWLAMICIPQEMGAMGGKLHGLVVLGNRLEQRCICYGYLGT